VLLLKLLESVLLEEVIDKFLFFAPLDAFLLLGSPGLALYLLSLLDFLVKLLLVVKLLLPLGELMVFFLDLVLLCLQSDESVPLIDLTFG
jgi:hypothetical protein